MTPTVLLYVLLTGPCTGSDCAKYAEYFSAHHDGGLIYTSKSDCEDTVKEFAQMAAKTIDGRTGETIDVHFEHYCAVSYFADYAQTERLTDGRVTCSYVTRMPESVMARRLSPYPDSANCHEKPKAAKP